MNDILYAASVLYDLRMAEVARENELVAAHRDRGLSLPRPHGRRLSAWFRTALGREPRAALGRKPRAAAVV